MGGEQGLCAYALTVLSAILIFCTAPFSFFFCVKVVQEYERAVIFRLGRLVRGKNESHRLQYTDTQRYTRGEGSH